MAKVKWQQIAEDDFKAVVGDYVLHVFDGFYTDVWWEVLYKGLKVGSCWTNDKDDIDDVQEAKRRAVNCINEHKIKNEKA